LNSFEVGRILALLFHFLGKVLLQDSLMTLCLFGLGIDVVQTDFVLNLSEYLVSFLVAQLCFLKFLDLAFGLFLKLISQGHEQIAFPDAKLCLSGTDFYV